MRHDFVGARNFLTALFVGLLLLVAPPARAQETAVSLNPAPAAAASAAPATTSATSPDYVLGVGDRLRITVFGEAALSGEFAIDSSGKVSLPLIGELNAGGLSVRQFQTTMETALKQGYLNDPRVSAEVMNFRPFFIMGEVTHPGQYPYTNNLTVLNAVATAGGFTPLANQTRVYVKHAGEDTEEQISLSGATPVAPGDTVRISKGAFYILGEVSRPGEYAYNDGMTALNAIATAGGFTYRANKGRVFIQHQGAEQEVSERMRPDLQIAPGDTIRVGERFF